MLGGHRKLFITMLKRLENLSLRACLQNIAIAMNQRDWLGVKNGVHQLKGASGYVGAGRVHYVCFHMQNLYNSGDYERLGAYYPLLLELSIEFKRFLRKYLEDLQGKSSEQLKVEAFFKTQRTPGAKHSFRCSRDEFVFLTLAVTSATICFVVSKP